MKKLFILFSLLFGLATSSFAFHIHVAATGNIGGKLTKNASTKLLFDNDSVFTGVGTMINVDIIWGFGFQIEFNTITNIISNKIK